MKRSVWILIPVVMMVSGCTWVEATDKGAEVSVATFEQVQLCTKLGKATVAVLDNIAFIPRSEVQVAGELQTMGKNSAAEMGGDTIVAVSKVIDGEQAFNVYRCYK